MPSNRERREFVKIGLDAYCLRTRHQTWDEYTAATNARDIEALQHEVVSDFVCDLMHLVDDCFGGDLDGVLSRARNHYIEELEQDCECSDDLVPGAFYPVEHDGDDSRAWVERCDNCKLFDGDHAAAEAVAKRLGVGWTHSGGTPWLVDPATRNGLPFGYGREKVEAP